MPFDAHPNFAYSTVLVPPITPLAGTTLTPVDDVFPDPATDGEYNVEIWPAGALPLLSTSEIARVTAKDTLTGELTITRTQEGSANRPILAGDQIAAAITRKVFKDIEQSLDPNTIVVGSHPDYPATPTGIQDANDALTSGGTIVIPNNTPIEFADGEQIHFTKSNLRVVWPASSPALAPATATPYPLGLIKIGGGHTESTQTRLSAPSNQGTRSATVVSLTGADLTPGSSFVTGDYVLLNRNGNYAMNRITDITGNVLTFAYPNPWNLVAGSPDSIVRVTNLQENFELVGDLRILNNGNTSYGLKTAPTVIATTTLTAQANKGATSVTVASIAGLAVGQNLVFTNGAQVMLGECQGYIDVCALPAPSGTTVNLTSPLPVTLPIGTTMRAVANSELLSNCGLLVLQTAYSSIKAYAKYVCGAGIALSAPKYENTYDIVAEQCGFFYQQTYSTALELKGDVGSHFYRSHSDRAMSWGWWMSGSHFCTGHISATGSFARNGKLATGYGNKFTGEFNNGRITGFCISDDSRSNELDLTIKNSGGCGLWIPDGFGSNVDNFINLYARGNNAGGADFGDVLIQATSLRTTINLRNNDAVIVDETTDSATRDSVWAGPDDFKIIGANPPTYAAIAGIFWGWSMVAGNSDQAIIVQFQIPRNYRVSHSVKLRWTNNSAGAGNVVWRAAYQNINDGSTLAVLGANTTLAAIAAPAQNVLKETTIALTLPVAVVPGQYVQIAVNRLGLDAGNTLAGAVAVIGIELNYIRR